MTDYELRSLYFTHNKELLSKYAKHKNAEYRRAVAWNEHTDEADLMTLSKDEDPMVRRNVLNNSSSPYVLLLEVAKSDNKLLAEKASETIEIKKYIDKLRFKRKREC